MSSGELSAKLKRANNRSLGLLSRFLALAAAAAFLMIMPVIVAAAAFAFVVVMMVMTAAATFAVLVIVVVTAAAALLMIMPVIVAAAAFAFVVVMMVMTAAARFAVLVIMVMAAAAAFLVIVIVLMIVTAAAFAIVMMMVVTAAAFFAVLVIMIVAAAAAVMMMVMMAAAAALHKLNRIKLGVDLRGRKTDHAEHLREVGQRQDGEAIRRLRNTNAAVDERSDGFAHHINVARHVKHLFDAGPHNPESAGLVNEHVAYFERTHFSDGNRHFACFGLQRLGAFGAFGRGQNEVVRLFKDDFRGRRTLRQELRKRGHFRNSFER